MMRDALVQPDNLRALLREVAPGIADHLDYIRVEVVGKPYFLDDWRTRDRDVLVRLPYLDGVEQRTILVCILIEHQSTTDQVMPLRMLVYAVFAWEQEWKGWEEGHRRGEPLRLTPILPVVLHTGSQPWDTNRSLADLFDVPAELRAWLPSWQMPLWDLPEHSTDELLKRDDAFWQVLAVARAGGEPAEEFLRTFREALTHLAPLGTQARVRWDQLLRMVLHWALFRRPHGEYTRLKEAARDSHSDVELKREVETMSQLTEKTWEEELKERFLSEGESRGELQGELRALRNTLRAQLLQRFQSLPDEVLQRIAVAGAEQLNAALASVLTLKSLDDLKLSSF
jgi:hypothetical protein